MEPLSQLETSAREALPAGGPMSTEQSLFSGIQNLQITGGTFSVAGRDAIHYCHIDMPHVLKRIPNLRDIHIATLARATPGTGEWIYAWELYCIWVNLEGHIRILWGFGMPGAGKTIMASIIINSVEALAKASASTICVAYLYIRYSDHSKATVRSFLEVLVKQVIERHPHCLSIFNDAYAPHIREGTQPSEADLLQLLKRFVGSMDASFYFLDALDEAPTGIQFDLVQKLASLDVKLFITSRPLNALQMQFPEAHFFPIIAQDQDLDLHIARGILKSTELRTVLEEAGPSYRDKFTSLIKEKCGGMFLHASLQLDALSDCTSIREVHQTLEDFPPSIEDVYLQTWKRILNQPSNKASLAKRVLVWVIYAKRSLRVDQLRHAVATCPITHEFDASRLVSSETLITLCRGLLAVEEESSMVRLVHYTAKDTLERLILEDLPNPHFLPAAVCMTLLADHGFQTKAVPSREDLEAANDHPLLTYAHDAWAAHALASIVDDSAARRLAEFVEGCHAFPVFISGWGGWFDVLSPLHVAAYFNLPISFVGTRNLRDPNLPSQVEHLTPLLLATLLNSERIVEELLALPRILVNATDKCDATPLILASADNREGIVKLLLNHRKVKINHADQNGWTALLRASLYGCTGIVKLLLARPGIKVNHIDKNGQTALHCASDEGREGVVKLLLAHPQVDAYVVDSRGATALQLASRGGHEGIVRLLLAHPKREIEVNAVAGPSSSSGRDLVPRFLSRLNRRSLLFSRK
ncbi:hypothetical protein BKA70DRAFT_1282843 [Coprinopsis sp. MPI-PUGE-AT-0042]|nr:hypothetical protein BKA70DRAFT_1282843 [Coprinopsis sp. MPI-PUGE-AT-0042]